MPDGAKAEPAGFLAGGEADAGGDGRGVFLVRLGRGRLGGTTHLDWAADRALAAGRRPVVADAARNPTLSGLHPALATVPRSVEAAEVARWITEDVVSLLVAEPGRSVLLDIGGGQDNAAIELARDLDLAALARDLGLRPVALYPMGADPEDFEYALRIRDAGAFAADDALLVVNEFLVPKHTTVQQARERLAEHPAFGPWVEAGMRPVFMRRMAALEAVRKAGVGFSRAARWTPGAANPVNPAHAQMTAQWLRAMEEAHARMGVLGWLP